MTRHNLSLAAILLSLVAAELPAQTGLITTIAGTGVAGTGGVGGPAANAQLSGPTGICVDTSLNVYVADAFNNRVVRINGNTGILTLAAGNGDAASTGDNGPAVQASLNSPRGLAVDAAGNLFIVEFRGSRVRRVDAATGIITTVVGTGSPGFSGDGGPGANAAIAFAFSIALDPSGNLYIADSGNARVRKVDATTGIITTVAGNGSSTPSPDGTVAVNAGLATPLAVSVDISGTLAIAESNNARIRLVDPSTGVLSTLAGDGSTAFTGDGIPATSAGIGKLLSNLVTDGMGNVYFPDATGRIRRVDSATRNIVTVAGNGSGAQGIFASAGGAFSCISTLPGDNGPATSATLDGPSAVAYVNGRLLITDFLDCRVRMVSLPSPNTYTNTTLTATSVNINQGDAVTFTAAVSSIPAGGRPTGSIQFIDQLPGSVPTLLGTAILSGSSASLTVTNLSHNFGHLIAAYYMGDSQFNGSGSPGLAVTVGPPVAKPSPTISMSAPIDATLNNATSISVTVSTPNGSTAQPTGSVVLYDGGTPIQTTPLANGVAQFAVTFTTLGSHAMSATYQGDTNYSQVTTSGNYVTVKGASSVSISSTPNPSVQGSAVTFTATMTPSTATGSVEFHYDSNILCTANIANGIASCSISSLPAGNRFTQAFYNGDSALMGSTSTIMIHVVQAVSTTTLTSSSATSTYGQVITFTANISPSTATGTVQFMDGAMLIGSAPVSGATASVPSSVLTAGTHAINAVYSGDTYNTASTSAALAQIVQMASVAITLTCSPNPAVAGQAVVCVATLAPTTPTGTVLFLDGTTPIINGLVRSGVTDMSVVTLSAGSHSITAVYSGDANYTGVTSPAVAQVVKAVTSTSVTSDTVSPVFGQTVNLIAAVSPTPGGGNVQFLDGAVVLGTATIAGPTVTLAVSNLAVGAHTITAAYSGDATDTPSTSSAITITVAKANSSVALLSGVNPATFGQTVTFTATVSPAAATGSVQFLDGATVLGTVTVSGGSAALATSSLSAGSHSIQAVYSGDASYTGSTSAPLGQTVNKASTTVVAGSTLNPSTFSQSVGLTALVTPRGATGTVQFLDGSTVLGEASLSSLGAAFINTSALSVGSHSITVVYSGDGLYLGSTSTVLRQVVNQWPTFLTIQSSRSPIGVGLAITFTAALTHTPAGATGSVQFMDGSTVLGTAALNSGSAALTTSSLSAGSHTITAVYSGDANFSRSSASLSQTVWNSTSVSLTSDKTSISYGQTITFTATLSPSTATGTVTFLDGWSVVLGTAPVSGGQAKFSIATLTGGSHSIIAGYSGDEADAPWSSAALTVTVAQVKPTVTVTASPDPAQVGQTLTLTATISGNTATGTVTFKDGAQAIGTATVSNGVAVFSTSALSAGNHSITAGYSGDINYTSATSNEDIVKVK
jgi:sugar lactone lactonase YvrE